MRLLLVDGHYYAYRSFHAIRVLTNAQGQAINAIFGFVKALRNIAADVKPDRAVVVFDGGLPEVRTSLQPEYKANRAEMPDELRAQLPVIEEFCRALGFVTIRMEGQEADDVIATATEQFLREQPGGQVVLATNDKDLMQLVREEVAWYATVKDRAEGFQLLGEKDVVAKWGVPPSRIADLLALTGDASDNIPGVPGIGPKTAAKLVTEFGSLERLMERLSEVSSEGTRAALESHRQQVANNLQMVTLNRSLVLEQGSDAWEIRPDAGRVVELAQRWGLRGLHQEFSRKTGETPASPAAGAWVQGELF
jgi:DNA polymerase-1